MRKNLDRVPVQVTLGTAPAQVAAAVEAAGDGLSIKGKSILIMSPSGLEKILSQMEVRPDISALIVAAAKRVARIDSREGDDTQGDSQGAR